MAKTETVYSKEAADKVQLLREELKDAETQVAADLKNDNRQPSDDAIRRVGILMKEISDITGEPPGTEIT
jgi:hypothetical protein